MEQLVALGITPKKGGNRGDKRVKRGANPRVADNSALESLTPKYKEFLLYGKVSSKPMTKVVKEIKEFEIICPPESVGEFLGDVIGEDGESHNIHLQEAHIIDELTKEENDCVVEINIKDEPIVVESLEESVVEETIAAGHVHVEDIDGGPALELVDEKTESHEEVGPTSSTTCSGSILPSLQVHEDQPLEEDTEMLDNPMQPL